MPHLELIRPRKTTTVRRLWDTVRAYTGPLSLKDPELARKLGWGGGATAAGMSVSEATALNYAAVWQAVTLIAGDVGSLPLLFYKRLKGGGKERYTDHGLYSLLHDAPNEEMSSMVFRETLQAHLLIHGNAYSEIERDQVGRPVALWPLMPTQVQPFRDDRKVLRYRVRGGDGRDLIFAASDILHIPGLGFDGTCGYSPIHQARESLGLLAAAERFGSTFFGNGSVFGGALSHPKTLGDAATKNLRASIEATHRGPDRAHRFLVLEEGMSFTKFGVDPNDAQFLETRRFQIEEVARWFNLPLHKLREMTNSSVRANIEQEALDYYTSTLRPWLTRWEQEINRKLVSPRERNIQFAEFLLEGVLRGDQKSRYDAYAIGRNWGWLNVNEIRALENLNPIGEDGNAYLTPLNMVPAARLNEVIDKQVEPTPAPVAPAQADGADPAPADAARTAILAQLAEQAANIGALQARHEQALEDVATAQATLEADRAGFDAERVRFESELAQAQATHDATVADFSARFEARGGEVDLARAETLAETHRARAADDRAAALQVERDEARTAQARAEADTAAAREQRDQAQALAATRAEAIDAALAQVAIAEQHATEAEIRRGSAETLAHDAEARASASEAAAREADAARTAAEQRATEADAARVTAVGALSDVREQLAGTLTALVTAHRAVLIETMSRLVRREAEKARSKRATPEKLRAWATSFYEAHEAEVWVEALRPVVALHQVLAGDGRDASAVARTVVDAHFAVSQRQILAVADADQAEYQDAVTGTLDRWETTRAAAVADAFLREEIAYVRTIQ